MVPVSDIVGLLPVFFNNLGTRESIFVLILGQFRVPAASALAIAFVVVLVRLLISALGGVSYAAGGLRRIGRDLAAEP